MSQAFHCRASEFFAVDNPWLAYQIDRAVWTFGSFIQGKIEERKEVASKKEKPKSYAPKYTPEQIERMIYGPLPEKRAHTPGEEAFEAYPNYLNIDIDQLELES